MTRSPLLKLPYLALENIIDRFSLLELINFSATSAKSRRILVSRSFLKITGAHYSKLFGGRIEFETRKGKQFTLRIDDRIGKKKGKKSMKMMFFGVAMDITEPCSTRCKTFQPAIVFMKFCEYFHKIFDCKIDKLHSEIDTTDWLITKKILDFGCKEVRIEWRIRKEGILKFVKDWMDSDDRKLDRMELFLDSEEDMKNLEEMEGFRPWDPEKRGQYYRLVLENFSHLNCSKGFDIEREDGLLASVVPHQKMVYFVVWHERFPFKRNF